MSILSTDAIIIHCIDYLESDKIVCALTRDRGIIHAIAKGAKRSKKRFPGTLEPFCEVSLDVFLKKEGGLHRLESAQLTDAHLGIRESLDGLAHSTILLELVREHLGQLDPSPSTYEHLKNALKAMEPEKQWFPVWCISLMNILSSLGYGLDLKNQSSIGHRKWMPSTMLSREAALVLLNASRLEKEVLQRLAINASLRREITAFLLGVCNHVSDKRLKSGSFLAKLLDFKLNQ